jgi:hypothetical protein
MANDEHTKKHHSNRNRHTDALDASNVLDLLMNLDFSLRKKHKAILRVTAREQSSQVKTEMPRKFESEIDQAEQHKANYYPKTHTMVVQSGGGTIGMKRRCVERRPARNEKARQKVQKQLRRCSRAFCVPSLFALVVPCCGCRLPRQFHLSSWHSVV